MTVLLNMQFSLSVKLSIILMNVFVKGQTVRLYQQNAVMWVIHATQTKPERRPCGSLLMKTMRSRAGKTFLYPKQVYCFKKVTDSLQDLINKPNFMENCEKWRNCSTQLSDNVLGDCFEGRVWKEFQYVDREPFLAIPNNFGLMLNVDWFQPTLHGSESIGVIYMVVMNLPREEWIIPGPKEPKHHINSFLQPLVDDLIDLWDGVI